MRFFLPLLIVACLCCLHPVPAHALKISPFKTTLVPGMGGSSQVFRIDNNSTEPAAVQVSVLTWAIQPDGTEVNNDAEDQFVVFPAQMVLKPHESRTVRVQWLGDPTVTSEHPYRIVAEQVPIDLKNATPVTTGLQLMVRFVGGLYVGPRQVKSNVTVKAVEKNKSGLRVTLANTGTGHSLLGQPILYLTLANGKQVQIPEKDLGALPGSNIHAGSERYFDIPTPSGLNDSIATARLEYKHGF